MGPEIVSISARFPLAGFLDALHRAAQAQNLRGASQVFKPHELVAAIPASIPGFEQQMAKSLGIKMNVLLKVGATNLAVGVIMIFGLLPDAAKFCIREFQRRHVRSGLSSTGGRA